LTKKTLLFFILIILLMLPQTVFADSLYFETRIEEHTLKLNINDGDLDMKASDGIYNSSYSLNFGEDSVQPIFDFFDKNLKPEDEVDYIKYPNLEKLTDSPESYVLNICNDKNCKTYFSAEKPLFTIEELENSEIFNVLETEIETFLEKVISIIAIIMIIVLVSPIFIFVIVIAKLSQRKNKNYTVKTTETSKKNELLNQLQQIAKEKESRNIGNKPSKRKRDPWTDNDKNDPFSL